MLNSYISVNSAILLVVLFVALLAPTTTVAANPPSAVRLQVTWISWPDKEVSQQQADKSEHYRDAKLEADLARIMSKTLADAGIRTQPDAGLIMQVNLSATAIDQRYTDSLFGTVTNRPTEYAGDYTVTIKLGSKTVSRHRAKFSFKSSYSAGRTTTTISKVKVMGLVQDWLARHIKRRKFQKALAASREETASGEAASRDL